MNLPASAQEALEAFASCPGWEQRARLLMQWGERLAPLSDDERNEANLVQGCASPVWLVADLHEGHWNFRAASEARLIRGLLAVLLARVNGVPHDELARLDLPDWFNQLGLSRQLSPSRSNGLNAVLQRMREIAAANS
jgi:cysteine desulfuration protein SufE